MARKSRKPLLPQEAALPSREAGFTDRIPTALYARLSNENNHYETDDSIVTQVNLLRDYIENRSDLVLVDSFVDNGYTGTNFERPEFLRMMEQVKSGDIRCIVVKDLSRFGRNYLETGYYIENLFPLLDVRLIAVTDDFDSSREADRNSLSVPIKNMVNAMYAKDVSRKLEAARALRKSLGIVAVPPSAPYGYIRCPESRKLRVDEATAPYVKMIFAWFLAGVSRAGIAKRLNLLGAPVPTLKDIFGRAATEQWTPNRVKGILHNPVYGGFLVEGKSEQSLCRGVPHHKIDRSRWQRYPGMHEPLVSPRDYGLVEQRIAASRSEFHQNMENREQADNAVPRLFYKRVYCGECGRLMNYGLPGRQNAGPGKSPRDFYQCRTPKQRCPGQSRRHRQDLLKILVMDQIRVLIRTLGENSTLLKKIRQDQESQNLPRAIRLDITAGKGRLRQLEQKKSTLYADYASGLLDWEEYRFLRQQTIEEMQTLNDEIQAAERKLLDLGKAIDSYTGQTEKLERMLAREDCARQLIDELVEKILVYKDSRIEIIFRCEDVFRDPLIGQCLAGGEGTAP